MTSGDAATTRAQLLAPVEKQLGTRAAALVARAADTIAARFVDDRHVIGVAVSAGSGVFVGINLDAGIGRAAVCAEAVALGAAIVAGSDPVDLVVAVRHPRPGEPARFRIVPPCGPCRELLLDHAPGCGVIVTDDDGQAAIVPARELLPHRYRSSRPAFAGRLDGVDGADGIPTVGATRATRVTRAGVEP